jgi:hypothetical protein
MSPKAWQDPETKVETYQAEVFGENDLGAALLRRPF